MKHLLLLSVFLSVSLSSGIAAGQDLDSTALLIIDIQEFYFPGGSVPLVEPERAAGNAALILDHFRSKGGLVVHVKHSFEPGGEIHQLVSPLPEEKVIVKNEVNAFLNTYLDNFLSEKKIRNLVLCGMQTHMCLEAATRAGHDQNYSCTVIEDACTTRDLKYKETIVIAADVHASTLATLKSYAKIMTTAEYLGKQ